jgi:hypothetical protein
LLNNAPGVHHDDPISQLSHHRQVMAHVDHRHLPLGPESLKLFKHSCLSDDVKPRGRLIKHYERRTAG